jgi:DNA repair photolyase
MLKVKEVKAKSVLNKSKIFDYCVNPYTGCQIGCRYCYARLFMRRYSGHKEPWGEFVDAKINAPEVLKEEKYELTRRCLKELAKKQFPVNIQTKSKLALRDLDLFQKFEEIEVGFTITTDNEPVARQFEPQATPVKNRLKALEKIHASGIRTYAFIGPILPGNPEKLAQDLEGKVEYVYIDRMNYLNSIKGFYKESGFERETTDSFFHEYKKRLTSELRKRRMKYEVLF